MKKKLIFLTLIAIFFTYIIYYFTKNDEITIVSLGDSLSLGMTPYDINGLSYNDYLKEEFEKKHKLKEYIPNFSKSRLTIKELIYEIKENKTITIKNKSLSIKQAIAKSDILTIAIGFDELSNINITTNIRKEFMSDFKELLSLIKSLKTNQVFILSLYKTNNNDYLSIAKINAIIRDITLSNSFNFIDISSLFKQEDFFPNTYYLNYLGHKKIYEKIKKEVVINSKL